MPKIGMNIFNPTRNVIQTNQYYGQTNQGSAVVNMSFRGGLNNAMLQRIANSKTGCSACGK
jgi:hypothetical protein